MSTDAMSLTAAPEELFPPRPGGMVDSARKKMAADAAQLAAMPEAAPARPKLEVGVQDHAAQLARARTFSVSTTANAVVELLGRDDSRRNAVVMTLDEPVVISFAQTAAEDSRNQSNAAGLSANGFVLPVNVPFTVPSCGVIYCTATSSTPTRVSVAAFSYPET